MKCEVCSRDVRPVVALDIDGTLGDYHAHFIKFAGAYISASIRPVFGRRLYDGSDNFGDWIVRTFGLADRRTYRDIKLAYRQGAQKRSMPCYSGARELAAAIRAAGADLWLTTSRPYLRLDNVDPDTRAWLERNRIEYDHLLYDDQKYRVLSTQVDPERVCAVLDDLPQMYDQAKEVFGAHVPILRKTRWNDAVERKCEVLTLYQARDMISGRIERWKQANNASAPAE